MGYLTNWTFALELFVQSSMFVCKNRALNFFFQSKHFCSPFRGSSIQRVNHINGIFHQMIQISFLNFCSQFNVHMQKILPSIFFQSKHFCSPFRSSSIQKLNHIYGIFHQLIILGFLVHSSKFICKNSALIFFSIKAFLFTVQKFKLSKRETISIGYFTKR